MITAAVFYTCVAQLAKLLERIATAQERVAVAVESIDSKT